MPQTNPETTTKGERTRQIILDAAASLIVEQGYAATSMRQIAERGGLASVGGIYNHFPSKDDVFRTIILERHPIFQIVPLMNAIESETVEDFVHQAAGVLIEELGRHPDFLNIMLTEVVEFKGEHVPLVLEKVFPLVLPLGERIGNLQGTIRPIPGPVLVRAFFGMFFSYYITGILLGPLMMPEMQANALNHFVEIFLHGILASDHV